MQHCTVAYKHIHEYMYTNTVQWNRRHRRASLHDASKTVHPYWQGKSTFKNQHSIHRVCCSTHVTDMQTDWQSAGTIIQGLIMHKPRGKCKQHTCVTQLDTGRTEEGNISFSSSILQIMNIFRLSPSPEIFGNK